MADMGHQDGKGRPVAVIVTPVYNGADFLEGAALASVRAQTYRPLVHVLLDNCSKDATPEIMARYRASVDYPVIHHRNEATLPQAQNFNAAVQMVPAGAAYFTMLCADDEMKPDAIAEMMALAADHPDMVMMGGRESVNGDLRPCYLPEGVSIFAASNVAARVLADDARLPFPHVMWRRDFLRAGEKFFDEAFVAFDAEIALKVLVNGGGLFGFVHKHLFNNIHHEAALTATLVRKKIPYLWEQLLLIERYGPAALSNTEYRRIHKKHLRVVYRRFLWWMLFGPRENYRRDAARFAERGLKPGFGAYLDALLSWPGHLWERRFVRPNRAFPWPDEAVRPGAAPAVHPVR